MTVAIQQWANNTCLQVYGAASLPDISCSQQWSISIKLVVPAAYLQAPADGSMNQVQLVTVLSGTDVEAGWPSVSMKVSSVGTVLMVQWGSSTNSRREQAVNFKGDRSNQLVVVRDGIRLGVWVNSDGSWLFDNVGCMPDSQSVNFCSKMADTSSADAGVTNLR